MQLEATDAFDITKEPDNVKTMYGAETQQDDKCSSLGAFARKRRSLRPGLARGWDHHNNLETALARKAEECDKPISDYSRILSNGHAERHAGALERRIGRSPSATEHGGQPRSNPTAAPSACGWPAVALRGYYLRRN